MRIFLVRFGDRGYYAAKQPKYEWSFTDSILDSHRYKDEKTAMRRARGHHGWPRGFDGKVTIEEFELVESFNFINSMPL